MHAPSATPDRKEGVIIIFNMNPGMKTSGWYQIMTLTRRLTLVSTNEIGIEPAGDIESLRYGHQKVDKNILSANEELVLKNVKGDAMELIVEIDPKDANMIELNVLRSPNKEEFTRISFYQERGFSNGRNYWPYEPSMLTRNPKPGLITLGTSYSSMLKEASSRAPETALVSLERNETLKFRVFIDKSVVEVFINGKQCVAARVYPGRDDIIEVSLHSQGSDSQLMTLDAWQMKNIYNNNDPSYLFH